MRLSRTGKWWEGMWCGSLLVLRGRVGWGVRWCWRWKTGGEVMFLADREGEDLARSRAVLLLRTMALCLCYLSVCSSLIMLADINRKDWWEICSKINVRALLWTLSTSACIPCPVLDGYGNPDSTHKSASPNVQSIADIISSRVIHSSSSGLL